MPSWHALPPCTSSAGALDPHTMGASGFTSQLWHYPARPQPLSALRTLDERNSCLVEKQVHSELSFSLLSEQ